MNYFKKIFKREKKSNISFKVKLNQFQSLLNSNDEALKLMSNLSELLASGLPFSKGKAFRIYSDIVKNAEEVAKHLSNMCEGKYKSLINQVQKINDQCMQLLTPKSFCPDDWKCPDFNCNDCEKIKNLSAERPYSYRINEITIEQTMEVGGKMSRLFEIHNKLKIPVPDGFCLTARCFDDFFSERNLYVQIDEIISSINFDDNKQIEQASEVIQALLVSTPIPQQIEKLILDNYDRLESKYGSIKLSVRSSAIGEDDPRYSFAGLHYTALNVSRANLIDACFEVLISKYLPQSLVYRYITGLRDADMPMSIGCIKMIDSEISGVLFTKDPLNQKEGIIIQAVRGLGTKVVDGSVSPQEFIIEHDYNANLIEFKPGNQQYKTIARSKDGLIEEKISEDVLQKPCLTKEQIKKLTEYALQIENHFEDPQDIEWTIDKNGDIYILQTRSLAISHKLESGSEIDSSDINWQEKYPVLINDGESGSPGVSSGQVFVLNRFKDLINFPTGCILVVKKTSPELTRVLHKASGLISDVGSTTGHLAIIARELGIPALLNTKNATEQLNNGINITLDTINNKVYLGTVNELINKSSSFTISKDIFKNSPMHRIWQNISKYVTPLNLTKPDSPKFTIQNCKTLHDVTRFAHEVSMRAMFSCCESSDLEGHPAYRLQFSVPLDIYVIDLGEGLVDVKGKKTITAENIISKPFRYLIKGMTTPGIKWAGPLPIDIKGFANIFMSNIVDSNRSDRDLGSRSYAFISGEYLNFFSRLGYHFSRLDTYASNEINSNYINFNFRGGAADPIRRARRAKVISKILEALNFTVTQKEDNVFATIRKIPASSVFTILSELGRLMGAVRNVDATLQNDEYINWFVDAFLNGDSAPALRFIEENKN